MDNGASSYRRFLDGDRTAMEEIVDLYRERLIFFIYGYVKNLDTAEDLAEDVFVELIVHPARFKEKSSLKTYLFAIARNKAVDWVRKHSRLTLVSLENIEDAADYRLLEDAVIQGEENLWLAEAMGNLKEEYRMAIHLVYLENLSYDEAGKIMKKSRKQIENLVYRGKQALKNELGHEPGDGLDRKPHNEPGEGVI